MALHDFLIEIAVPCRCALGEGPLWDPGRGLLYWSDITRGVLHRLDPATSRHEEFPAGGQVGGSGHLPERSAALIVRGRSPAEELDLRVDSHPEAVAQLRALREEWAPYRAFHHLRHVDPARAPPQEQFVTELAAAQRRGAAGSR